MNLKKVIIQISQGSLKRLDRPVSLKLESVNSMEPLSSSILLNNCSIADICIST